MNGLDPNTCGVTLGGSVEDFDELLPSPFAPIRLLPMYLNCRKQSLQIYKVRNKIIKIKHLMYLLKYMKEADKVMLGAMMPPSYKRFLVHMF